MISNTRSGFKALSPILLLIVSFVLIGILAGDFYKVPMLIVFILVAAYAMCFTGRDRHSSKPLPLLERLAIFSRGAGDRNLLQMVWIFVLAGAFANSARAAGCIEAMVNLTLAFIPSQFILVGLFLAAMAVSVGIGTSVGTIVAIVPFASDLAASSGLMVEMAVAAVVGGALFGDNLSFISDTTVAATQKLQIAMKDKFLANARIAFPAAFLTALIYVFIGLSMPVSAILVGSINWLYTLPYLFVIVSALCGLNVLVVLFCANVFVGLLGVCTGGYSWLGWTDAMTSGIASMGELILISMIAGGLMALIRYNGGITWLIYMLRRHISGPKGAALAMAGLVSVIDFCTANNTIAILTVGDLARDIADHYGVSRRRAASILDTFSCCVQGVLPYGAQLLMAGGIAAVSPIHLIPYLFYPMVLFVGYILYIVLIPDIRASRTR